MHTYPTVSFHYNAEPPKNTAVSITAYKPAVIYLVVLNSYSMFVCHKDDVCAIINNGQLPAYRVHVQCPLILSTAKTSYKAVDWPWVATRSLSRTVTVGRTVCSAVMSCVVMRGGGASNVRL